MSSYIAGVDIVEDETSTLVRIIRFNGGEMCQVELTDAGKKSVFVLSMSALNLMAQAVGTMRSPIF